MYVPHTMQAIIDPKAVLDIAHVYADVEKRYAIATDGTILVAYPIEPDEGEVSGYLPKNAIEFAAKGCGKKHKVPARLHHTATHTVVDGVSFHNPFTFPYDRTPDFPDWQSVLPRNDEKIDVPAIGVNAMLLVKLQNVFGTTHVTLHPTEHYGPMWVNKDNEQGILAIIMPCTL